MTEKRIIKFVGGKALCITYRVVSIGVTLDGRALVNLPGAGVASAGRCRLPGDAPSPTGDESHSRHVHGSQQFFNLRNNDCFIFMTVMMTQRFLNPIK